MHKADGVAVPGLRLLCSVRGCVTEPRRMFFSEQSVYESKKSLNESPNRLDCTNMSDLDNLSSTRTRFNTINDEHYIIGPTVILDLLMKHVLLRYPILLPILQKFNCYHIAQATVTDTIVKNRIQQGPF